MDEGLFHRGPRPLMGWGGVALIAVCIVFLIAMAFIAVYALWRWANGEPVDLMGFAAVLGAATSAGSAVWSIVKNYIQTRSYERSEQIKAGVAPAGPLSQTPSPSWETGVNPHGGPGAP